jgi:hypothetical protein
MVEWKSGAREIRLLTKYHAQYWLNLAKSKFCVNLVAAKRRATKFVALAPPRAANNGRRPAAGGAACVANI